MRHRRNSVEIKFKQGETIFLEGHPGNKLFIIRSGSVALTTKVDDSVMPLTELGAGEVFGEMSLIDEKPRSATATAVTEVACQCISKAIFRNKFNEEVPIWMRSLYQSMAHRLRATTLRSLTGVSEFPARRVVEMLSNYLQRGQITYSGATYIPWNDAVEKTANLLSTGNSTVEKVMDALVQSGFANYEVDPTEGKRFLTRSPQTFFLFADYCWDSYMVDQRGGRETNETEREANLVADVELLRQILSVVDLESGHHDISSKKLFEKIEGTYPHDRSGYETVLARLKARMLILTDRDSEVLGALIINIDLCQQEVTMFENRSSFEAMKQRIMSLDG